MKQISSGKVIELCLKGYNPGSVNLRGQSVAEQIRSHSWILLAELNAIDAGTRQAQLAFMNFIINGIALKNSQSEELTYHEWIMTN